MGFMQLLIGLQPKATSPWQIIPYQLRLLKDTKMKLHF